MEDISIRPYQERDRAQIAQLFEEFLDYVIEIDPLKMLKKGPDYGNWSVNLILEQTKDNGLILVAEQAGKIIGYISGKVDAQTPEEKMEVIPLQPGKILEFFVTQELRAKGVGSLLYNEMVSFLKKNGCNVVRLSTFFPNVIARSFYKKNGFHERIIDYIKPI